MFLNRLGSITRQTLKRITGLHVRCLQGPPVEFGGYIPLYRNMPEYEREEVEPQKTFSEISAEIEAMKPSVEHQINIGIDYQGIPSKRQERIAAFTKNRKDLEMERNSRLQRLKIPLSEVKEEWFTECGPAHEKTIAEHYGIYRDLFNGGYFYSVVPLTVAFDYDEELVTPAYLGNYIPAAEAKSRPNIAFEPDEDYHYTLVMTNPDGHFENNEAEYLHWAIGNIKDGDISKGEVICDYLPPFPCRGTGMHRFIFILYRHKGALRFSHWKTSSRRVSLKERTFSSKDFYESYEGKLEPVGLRFFQSDWDHTVSDIYHKVLDMKEPEYEYMHPPPYHPPQVHYPDHQPFDRYFDRYRDKKELREEVLKMKLAMISPYKEHPKQFQYPNIHRPKGHKFSWLKRRDDFMNRRLEQYKDLPK